jgi:hypothetical protein
MTMKKVLLALVAVLLVTSVSAQKWSVGGRVGSGFEVVGQYSLNETNYIEARFGASWLDVGALYKFGPSYEMGGYIMQDYYTPGITADFTALYNWHVLEFDWTPKAGKWFFDAGAGLNVGGAKEYAYFGLAGMARLGFTFNKVPLTLAVDYTPTVGLNFIYMKNVKTDVNFRHMGLANVGITCTYNF